jgi:hypothetical protein
MTIVDVRWVLFLNKSSRIAQYYNIKLNHFDYIIIVLKHLEKYLND